MIVADVVATYDTPQEPKTNGHGLAEKMPAVSVLCHVTFPLGEYPDTVAVQVVDCPAWTFDGEQDNTVDDNFGEMVTVAEPKLPKLLGSAVPGEYVPVTLTPPALVVATVTLQVPETSVHGLPETVALPAPEEVVALKATVPAGVPYPVTVAVHVLEEPTVTGLPQVTKVVVVALLTVIDDDGGLVVVDIVLSVACIS